MDQRESRAGRPQYIVAPDGTELAVLPRAELERLQEEVEEAKFVADAVERRAAGERTIPAALLARILDEGVHPVTAWREHGGLKKSDLAKLAGISPAYLWQIESGRRQGSLKVMLAVAEALGTDVELLVLGADEA
jgi:DNA-binding XRE family transcriptional regulator